VIAVGVLVGLIVAAWAVALCLSRVRRLHRLHIRVDAARAGLDAALARRAAAASAAGVVVPGGLATGTTPASRRPRSTMAVPRAAVDAEAGASVPGRLWSTAVPRAAVDAEAGATVPGRLRSTAVPHPAVDNEAGSPVSGRSRSTTTMPQAVVDPEAAANALGRALARLDRATLPADVRAALTDAEQLLVLARRVHNDAVRDTLGLRSRRLVRWLRLAGTAPMPAYFEIADPAPALKYDRVSPSQE
jgi:hypothetical protein